MRILGLMSGTSCDGLDCIDVNLNLDKFYNFEFKINNFSTFEYTQEEKLFLSSLRDTNYNSTNEDEDRLSKIFINHINSFMNKYNDRYDLIACHGHTVKHIDKVISIQLISPEMLYNIYKTPIVYNFRESDISHGGNGAPLMPFLDYLLFASSKANIVTLNIGGISNVTYIPNSGNKSKIIGFDTGPGMSLIDKASEIFFGESIDRDSVYSKKGKVNKILLNELMKIDYIFKVPPKSTDSNEFGYALINNIINKFSRISSFDIIRTLVQFTIDSIQFNINKYIKSNDFKLVYSGGGTEHPIISTWLNNMTCITESISSYGIDSSIKESLLMASLGYSRVKKIPNNMPSVTGAKEYILLGDIYER